MSGDRRITLQMPPKRFSMKFLCVECVLCVFLCVLQTGRLVHAPGLLHY